MKVFFIFVALVCVEFILESYLSRRYYATKSWWFRHVKLHHFSAVRYLFFFGIPFATIAAYVFVHFNWSYIVVYMVFAAVGTALEWMIGYAYHGVVGQRLWTYHTYSIYGYTSFLSVPIWGFAGILFWSLSERL